jgi:hypothetical protein
MLVIDCEPDVTVNRPTPVKGVPFVVTVTSRIPRVAPAATVMFAARPVALLNATELVLILRSPPLRSGHLPALPLA